MRKEVYESPHTASILQKYRLLTKQSQSFVVQLDDLSMMIKS